MSSTPNQKAILLRQKMKVVQNQRSAILVAGLVVSACSAPTIPSRSVEQDIASDVGTLRYSVDLFIPGSAMHGVHGLAFDSKGGLYGASLTGYSIYRIDRDTGEVTTEIGPHLGNSDDLAFGPGGMLAWTAGAYSAIHARMPDGEIRTLADELPGVNSINFSPDGRCIVYSYCQKEGSKNHDISVMSTDGSRDRAQKKARRRARKASY